MSMQMNNIQQGGYVPPAFGAGYGMQQPNAPPETHHSPGSNFGFKQSGGQGGYAPVPQMQHPSHVHPSYGEVQHPGNQPPYAGAPFVGGQPPYAGGQPPYGGQSPYGGAQPPQQYGPQPPYGGYQPGYDAYGPQPIVNQPTGPAAPPGMPGTGEWMSIPVGDPNCPRGLEYLLTVDQLLVKQKVELLEAFTGFVETNNKFSIKNTLGQKVYFAVEENDCCTRNVCGPSRPFDMRIYDNYKNEVLHLNRPLACDSCYFPCCLQTMEVSAPPGNVIGSIEQEWSICTPSFRIKNQTGDTVLRIEGPLCTFTLCGDVEFKVVSLTGEQVGKISKHWSGLAREIFTDADFFGITFPMDLDVRMKATLLGATFLIDAMFFEKRGNREGDRPGML